MFNLSVIILIMIIVFIVDGRPPSCQVLDESLGKLLCCTTSHDAYKGRNCRILVPIERYGYLNVWSKQTVDYANALLSKNQAGNPKTTDSSNKESKTVPSDDNKQMDSQHRNDQVDSILEHSKSGCCCKEKKHLDILEEAISADGRKWQIYQEWPNRVQVVMQGTCLSQYCLEVVDKYLCQQVGTIVPQYVIDEVYPEYLREVKIKVKKGCSCRPLDTENSITVSTVTPDTTNSEGTTMLLEDERTTPLIVDEGIAPHIEDETTTPPIEDEGTTPPIEGEGTTPPIEGEGTTPPIEGEGTTPPIEGEGTTPPIEGEGTTPPIEGEGTTPPIEDEVTDLNDHSTQTMLKTTTYTPQVESNQRKPISYVRKLLNSVKQSFKNLQIIFVGDIFDESHDIYKDAIVLINETVKSIQNTYYFPNNFINYVKQNNRMDPTSKMTSKDISNKPAKKYINPKILLDSKAETVNRILENDMNISSQDGNNASNISTDISRQKLYFPITKNSTLYSIFNGKKYYTSHHTTKYYSQFDYDHDARKSNLKPKEFEYQSKLTEENEVKSKPIFKGNQDSGNYESEDKSMYTKHEIFQKQQGHFSVFGEHSYLSSSIGKNIDKNHDLHDQPDGIFDSDLLENFSVKSNNEIIFEPTKTTNSIYGQYEDDLYSMANNRGSCHNSLMVKHCCVYSHCCPSKKVAESNKLGEAIPEYTEEKKDNIDLNYIINKQPKTYGFLTYLIENTKSDENRKYLFDKTLQLIKLEDELLNKNILLIKSLSPHRKEVTSSENEINNLKLNQPEISKHLYAYLLKLLTEDKIIQKGNYNANQYEDSRPAIKNLIKTEIETMNSLTSVLVELLFPDELLSCDNFFNGKISTFVATLEIIAQNSAEILGKINEMLDELLTNVQIKKLMSLVYWGLNHKEKSKPTYFEDDDISYSKRIQELLMKNFNSGNPNFCTTLENEQISTENDRVTSITQNICFGDNLKTTTDVEDRTSNYMTANTSAFEDVSRGFGITVSTLFEENEPLVSSTTEVSFAQSTNIYENADYIENNIVTTETTSLYIENIDEPVTTTRQNLDSNSDYLMKEDMSNSQNSLTTHVDNITGISTSQNALNLSITTQPVTPESSSSSSTTKNALSSNKTSNDISTSISDSVTSEDSSSKPERIENPNPPSQFLDLENVIKLITNNNRIKNRTSL